MKITIYELLGKVKDDIKTDIYVKHFNRISQKEDIMWACKENIIYKLDQTIIELNDEVEIIEEDKKIEKIDLGILNTQSEKNREFKRAINELIDEVNKLKVSK